MKRLTGLVLWLLLPFAVAFAETTMGWIEGGPLKLTEAEAKEFKSAPLFKKRLGRIRMSLGNWKFAYGDFTDQNGMGKAHVEGRLQGEFVDFMKEYIPDSGIFPSDIKDRIGIQVTLLGMKHQSSVGASVETAHPLTSGAVMTTELSLRYELTEQDAVVGAWNVTTASQSNSIQASTRLADSTDGALKRNLRSFLLQVIADFDPNNATRAKAALAAIGTETDNTRGLMGYVVIGVGTATNTTVEVLGSTVKLLAENADVISEGLDAAAEQRKQFNRDFEAAYVQALSVSRQTSVSGATGSTSFNEAERASTRHSGAVVSTNSAAGLSPAPAPPPQRTGSPITVTLPAPGPPCPPGSTWYNPATGIGAPGGTCYRNSSAAGAVSSDMAPKAGPGVGGAGAPAVGASSRNDPLSADGKDTKKEKKTEWGPIQLEAVAICRQGKNKKWRCSGPLDDEILFDSPTLEASLARQSCAGGTWAAGGPIFEGVQWEAYLCGRGLTAGDYDVAKRHSLITARRSYMCPKYEPSDGRCRVIYDGQDRR